MENNFRPKTKTVWYPPDIKPVRDGWYECLTHRLGGFLLVKRYWCKNEWYYNEYPIGGCWYRCLHQDHQWRGLTLPHDSRWLRKK
jgi:hypothetical protein